MTIEKCQHGVPVRGFDNRCFRCDPILGAAIPISALDEFLRPIQERAEKAERGPITRESDAGGVFKSAGMWLLQDEVFWAHRTSVEKDVPALIAMLKKAIEQRDFYLKDARMPEDIPLAKRTDEAELLAAAGKK